MTVQVRFVKYVLIKDTQQEIREVEKFGFVSKKQADFPDALHERI